MNPRRLTVCLLKSGALGRVRTDDNQFTKLVLYQLSYKGELNFAVIRLCRPAV